MSERKRRVRSKKQVCVNVDVGNSLSVAIRLLRSRCQKELGTRRYITLGAVVRLAIRRLLLAECVHDNELKPADDSALLAWERIAREIQSEGACPDWLVPGRPAADSGQVDPVKQEGGQ
jgi:hypothetical protein